MKKFETIQVPRTLHTCSFCRKDFIWTEQSEWYGNYKLHGHGYERWEKENVLAKACGIECVEAMKRVYPEYLFHGDR